MAKNNRFINQSKLLHMNIDRLLPEMYGAMALAMHRSGISPDDISFIFALSQEIWQEEGTEVARKCEEETGICVQLDRDNTYARRKRE